MTEKATFGGGCVFFHSPEQGEQALASKARVQARFECPVVTEVEPAAEFWRAEEHHQQYLVKRGLPAARSS